MQRLLEKIRDTLQAGGINQQHAALVLEEFADLQRKNNDLEAALIMLVRTGAHYENQEISGDDGALREGFATAMKEARSLLGLEHRSVLTRTEPRT